LEDQRSYSVTEDDLNQLMHHGFPKHLGEEQIKNKPCYMDNMSCVFPNQSIKTPWLRLIIGQESSIHKTGNNENAGKVEKYIEKDQDKIVKDKQLQTFDKCAICDKKLRMTDMLAHNEFFHPNLTIKMIKKKKTI
jgi:hypothetical protein